jgi:hypothetical protein
MPFSGREIAGCPGDKTGPALHGRHMPSTNLPRRESLLVPFLVNLNTKVQLAPATYNIPAPVAADMNTKTNAYVAQWNLMQDPNERTPPAFDTKTILRDACLGVVRPVINIIMATPTLSDAQRAELGLSPRDLEPSPIPTPNHAPIIGIISVSGRLVSAKLIDATDSNNRGRPLGVRDAVIYSHNTATPPASLLDWKIEGTTTRVKFSVQFPTELAPGATVWITAAWRNPVGQAGPATPPVELNLAGGLPQAA